MSTTSNTETTDSVPPPAHLDDIWCQDDDGLPPMPGPTDPLRGSPWHDDQACAEGLLRMVATSGRALVPRDLRECLCLYLPSSRQNTTHPDVWNKMVEHFNHLVFVPVDPSVRQRCQQMLDDGIPDDGTSLVTAARELTLAAVLNAGPSST